MCGGSLLGLFGAQQRLARREEPVSTIDTSTRLAAELPSAFVVVDVVVVAAAAAAVLLRCVCMLSRPAA